MRIIKITISNFGALSGTEISFGDDFLQFSEDNGYGKTTICAFIKAMFYGLAPYRANSHFNDRARYAPYSKDAAFGGSIEFEYNDKPYRILRNFDSGSGKGDTLTVLCRNRACDDLGDTPGITVFGIDEDAFSRTLFVDTELREINANTTVLTALGGLTQGSNDEDIKKVIDRISSATNSLNGQRANSDKDIPKLKAKIAELAIKQRLIEQFEKNIANISHDYAEKKKIFDDLNKSYEDSRIMKSWSAYDDMMKLANDKIEEAKKIEAKYNGIMPTRDELERFNRNEKTIELNNEKIRDSQFDLEDRLNILKNQYKDFKKPSEIAMADMEEHVNRIKLMDEVKNNKSGKGKISIIVPIILFVLALGLVVAGLFMSQLVKAILIGVGIASLVLGVVLLFLSFNSDKGGFRDQDKQYEITILNMAMSKYGDYQGVDGFVRLQNDISAYDEISDIENKKADYDNKIASYKQLIVDAERDYNILVETHNITEEVSSADMQKDINAFESLIASAKEYKANAEQIKEVDGLTERPENVRDVDLKKINMDITNASNDMADIKRLLDTNIANLEETKAQVAELDGLKEQLLLLEERYKVLDATKAYLTKAMDAIKNQYISPVKNSFDQYSNALEKVIGAKIHIDEEYRLTVEENNELRDINHLSSGERSIVYLCLRLAFIDNMFKVNKPFIVLDDPFIYLDKKHFTKVKTLLKDISTDMQVIYFTCHDSRKII